VVPEVFIDDSNPMRARSSFFHLVTAFTGAALFVLKHVQSELPHLGAVPDIEQFIAIGVAERLRDISDTARKNIAVWPNMHVNPGR
jgi:hypothetical protein